MSATSLLNIAGQIHNSSGYSYSLPWTDYLTTRTPTPAYTENLNGCCDDGWKNWVEENVVKKETKDEPKEGESMKNTMFNDIFGRIQPGMCRISMSGKIAIKTDHGYKSYDHKTGKLTNCDNFAFDVGEEFFFVIPTNKVKPGDIILVNGKPRCVLEVGKNEIKTFYYEDGTISTIVPERHMFLGTTYFYGKIVSLFGEMGKSEKNDSVNRMMKFMMLKQMMNGTDVNSNLPILAMMGGFGGSGGIFDGIFDFGEADEDDESNDGGAE